MKLQEFKAWFDGFTESMEGRPTDKQWKRIKEQVKAIDGTPISYPVYVDRYLSYVKPYWHDGITWYASANNARTVTGNLLAYSTSNTRTTTPEGHAALSQNNFDGVSAMYAAGKAEADHGFIHDNGV